MTAKDIIKREKISRVVGIVVTLSVVGLVLLNSCRKERIYGRVIQDYQDILDGVGDRDSLLLDIHHCIGDPHRDWYEEMPMLPHFWD